MLSINKQFIRLTLLICILFNLTGCAIIGIATTATTGMMIAEERTTGDIIDDNLIKTKIKNELFKTDFNNLFAKVDVNSYEGRVMLTGTVTEQKYMDEAVKISWSIKGVKEVINEIQISTQPQSNKVMDSWLTTQVKIKFLLNKELQSVNYTIEVHNKVVYLLGVAQNQNEIDLALQIASKTKGVVKVVNHIIIKGDIRRQEGIY